MEWGQVPSHTRDFITGNVWLDPAYLKKFRNSLEVKKTPYPNLVAKRKPAVKYFSKTDIECLKESLKKYGTMPFSKLRNISHEEPTWLQTGRDQEIDYALMVDEDNPNKKEILEEMRSNAVYARF